MDEVNEHLLQIVSGRYTDERRPVLRSAPLTRGYLRDVERRTGGRSRRSSDQAAALPGICLFAAAFEKLNRGVLLLDADGRVCFANRSADQILNRRNGITLRHGRFSFTDPAACAAFNALLQRRDGSLVLRIDGSSPDHGTYRVLVSHLNSEAEGQGCCVFIYEPDAGRQPLPEPILRSLYDLTAAEARLTNALFTGHSLQEAATSLGISLNTAKTTLKRVFGKCEVGTQAELLQLLSLGPRTL